MVWFSLIRFTEFFHALMLDTVPSLNQPGASSESLMERTSSAVAVTPGWIRAAPVIFLLLWSTGFSVVKVGLAYTGPLTLLTLRYALVLLALVPAFLALRPALPKNRAAWAHLAVVGLLMHVVYVALGYMAIRYGMSVGAVALIVSMQPILVALLSPALIGEQVGARQWAGLALGLLGAGIVIASRSAVEASSVRGVLLAFGSLAGITAALLYEKRFGTHHHPVTSNLVQYVAGMVVALPLSWAAEGMQVAWSRPFVWSLAYLVLANSLVAMTLLMTMVRRGAAARVSSLFFLVPVVAALISWALLGERMPGLAWIGMGIAVFGVSWGQGGPK